jgi:hypothetical protein
MGRQLPVDARRLGETLCEHLGDQADRCRGRDEVTGWLPHEAATSRNRHALEREGQLVVEKLLVRLRRRHDRVAGGQYHAHHRDRGGGLVADDDGGVDDGTLGLPGQRRRRPEIPR